MSDEKRRIDRALDDEEHSHPFALGILAGASVGVGLALLFAPHAGSETRRQVGGQLSRAKSTTSDWAHRSKDFISHRSQDTGRYLREVSEAVTMKSRKKAGGSAKTELSIARDKRSGSSGHS